MNKSETERVLRSMPGEGFLKVTRPPSAEVTPEQKVQLIRKGNELFSKGDLEPAKKIFVATRYSDGMIRLGDHYAKQKDYLSAYQMYKMAPAPDRAEAMVVKLSTVLKNWLKEQP
ncbi:MAG TPA: hypothetical protein VMB23_08780 [Spirochaetia bacterium]|jgi:hypothetical protein|nr:hypothetical protein [Spirochaetia bacterium]